MKTLPVHEQWAHRARVAAPFPILGEMQSYSDLLTLRKDARAAWDRNRRMAALIAASFTHLQTVMTEAQKTDALRDEPQRRSDFLLAIQAVMRCALHYQFHCQDGCFADAQFYLRKVMEYLAAAVAIGYDPTLYAQWTQEAFDQPKRGFTYLTRLLLHSSHVPEPEKTLLRWSVAREGKNPSRYSEISGEIVHGLSCQGLRSQLLPQGHFNMDVTVLGRAELDEKMRTTCILLLNAATLVLGALRYGEHVTTRGVSPAAEKVREEHERLQRLLVDEENRIAGDAPASPPPAAPVVPAAVRKRTRRGKRGGRGRGKRAAPATTA